MRIHQLELQAFGPYKDTEIIDFDDLGADNLFVLSGPTGAGKSSILDAICFALYGSVPGNRPQGETLKSQYAPDTREPYVLLTFSVAAVKYQIRRSPAWLRASTRAASGIRKTNAKANLSRFTGENYEALTSGTQEVGHEVRTLLNMDKDQFTKVMLLAQGEFAAFLNAEPEAKSTLLIKLFGDDIYELVEQELKAKSDKFKAEQQQHELKIHTQVETLVHRFSEFLPPDSSSEILENADQIISAEYFEQLCAEVAKNLSAQMHTTQAQHSVAAAEEKQAHTLLGTIKQERTDFAKAHELSAMIAEQNKNASVVAGYLKSLELHEMAKLISTSALKVSETEQEVHNLTERIEEVHSTILQLSAALNFSEAITDSEQVEQWRSTLRTLENHSIAYQQQGSDIAENVARHSKQEETLKQLNQDLSESLEASKALELSHADLVARIPETAHITQNITTLKELLSKAQRKEEKLAELESLKAHLVSAKTKRHKAEGDELKQLQLQHQYAAGLLAQQLQADTPCAVCGSKEHPDPAREPKNVDFLNERQRNELSEEVAQLRIAENAAEEQVGQCNAELANLEGALGGKSQEQLHEELLHQRSQLQHGEKLREELAGLETQVVNQQQRSETKREKIASLKEQLAGIQATLDTATTQRQKTVAEHSQGIHDIPSKEWGLTQLEEDSAQDHLQQVQTLGDSLAQLAPLLPRVEVMHNQQEQLKNKLSAQLDERERQLKNSVFDTLHEALAAELTVEQVADITQQLDKDKTRATHIQIYQSDDSINYALGRIQQGEQGPDQQAEERAAQSYASKREALDGIIGAKASLEKSQSYLEQQQEQLQEHIAASSQAGEYAQMLQSLASVATANNSENLYKMRLSSFVLAARLEQVTQAASQRLDGMSEQRFSLELDDTKSGNKKSGLNIKVLDTWTGTHRPVSTLSGGETFMASLALALGLSDVVLSEAGATPIDTLFVDEGFGTLDSQTLENVLGTLAELGSGGRMVGVVSHVSELKARIPRQLEVIKTRHGSRTAVHNGADGIE